MESTSAYGVPIKYDRRSDFLLCENGDLVVFDSFDHQNATTHSLADICQVRDIRDVVYYDDGLIFQNYWSPDSYMFPSEDEYFILVVTPARCFKLDTEFNVISVFGDSGSSGEYLEDAKMADMDYQGNAYVLDEGDNSLKKYDINGVFLQHLTPIEAPEFIDFFADHFYILANSSDKIDKYDSNGTYEENIIDDVIFHDIVAFRVLHGDEIWLIDDGGRRITNAFWGDPISLFETKTDYCFEDQIFDFQELVWVDTGFKSFVTLDKAAGYILYFSM